MHLNFLAVEPEAPGDRGHDLAAEGFQVVRREQPVVLSLMREDLAHDVAPVERMAYRREAGHAVAAGGLLLIAEELQDSAQVGLHHSLSGRGHRAARHPDRHVFRPVTEVVGALAHVVEHHRVPGEAFAGVAHRPRRHVAEGHRAPAFQRLETGIGRSRHDGAPDAQRDRAPVTFG